MIQDKYFRVKYTDIDYDVYLQASHTLKSPKFVDLYIINPTYRYNPLIAYITLIDIYFVSGLCKFIYASSDIVAALFINKLSSILLHAHSSTTLLFLIKNIWLYNPLVIAISTRGNFDSLICCLFAFLLHEINKPNSCLISSFLYGLCIHLRIFPILFIPTFYFFLLQRNSKFPKFIFNYQHFIFFGTAFLTFTILTFYFYKIFHQPYINSAFLYHLIYRKDFKHNFSMHFYPTYLSLSTPILSHFETRLDLMKLYQLLSLDKLIVTVISLYIPFKIFNVYEIFNGNQLSIVVSHHIHKLASCLLIITLTFVTFNKVITSQYFLWPLIFLPIVLAPSFNELEQFSLKTFGKLPI
ncbi:uncharacterized protein LOC135924193 [Gordionus sp. m RMFG-2023]|uniref:uncharacterized protein LOC135924193 n=1 Tax=Gordionus sp. m RMFG-2023 TaxID=3053472 RepID=UPI0031FCE6C5